MLFYFWVKETESHDKELEMIEADSLEVAKQEFSEMHPEDVDNLDEIYIENEFAPVWVAE